MMRGYGSKHRPKALLSTLLLASLLAFAGCESEVQSPDLGFLYNELAMNESPERNPVILIPGILGSRLTTVEDGRVAWGAWGAGFARASDPAEARLIALPMRHAAPLAELTDNLTAEGALDRIKVSFLGLNVELKAYHRILRTLGVGGYRDEEIGEASAIDYGDRHYTCFQFAYDWRRDLVESAQRLHDYIIEKRAYVQREIEHRFGIKNHDVRFDIVAHSMGGLVARYYLRYGAQDLPPDGSLPTLTWAGAKYVERVIFIGTPNGGSLDSFKHLVEGVELLPSLPSYDAALLGTMPSIYQLMPRHRHRPVVFRDDPEEAVDITDPAVWERLHWGLVDPEQDATLAVLLPELETREARLGVARDHLRKSLARAIHFQRAMDEPATPPRGLTLHLIAGDAARTNAVAEVDRDTGRIAIREDGPGDGSVLRGSALLDERMGSPRRGTLISPIAWDSVQFLFSDHLGLTEDPAFADNVLFLLLEKPRIARSQ